MTTQPKPEDQPNVQRRSAQAMIATYLQMARSTDLAQYLHRARERNLERRLEGASPEVAKQLQRQLEGLQSQGATINAAADRLRARAEGLASFAEAGLTHQDFQDMGLGDVVTAEQVAEAQQKAEEKRRAANAEPRPTSEEEPSTP